MFKNPEIREFFNARAEDRPINHALAREQLRRMSALEVVANQALAGHGKVKTGIVGTHDVQSGTLPVVRFSFSNGSSMTVMDRGEGKNCIVAVRSSTGPVKEELIADIAYSMTRALPADVLGDMPKGAHAAYHDNPRCFTFLTDEQAHLGRFMAQFAIQQRQAAVPAATAKIMEHSLAA